MLSIFNKRPDAASRSRVGDRALWSMPLAVKVMKICIYTLRKYNGEFYSTILADHKCSGPDANDVQKAKELCEDLLANVRVQYEEFKSRPPQRGYGQNTGYGGERGYGDRNQDRSHSYGGGYGGYSHSPTPTTPGTAMSPPGAAAPGAGSPTTGADYAAQYAQYYGGADPYAAYGGYAA